MFGAIGWGLVALVCGSLVDWFSGGTSEKNYSILLYLSVVILIGDLLIVYSLQVGAFSIVIKSVLGDGRLILYP